MSTTSFLKVNRSSVGTVGKYPVFIFGIFQIVGGACQAGIMKTLDMQEGRNVRFYQKI